MDKWKKARDEAKQEAEDITNRVLEYCDLFSGEIEDFINSDKDHNGIMLRTIMMGRVVNALHVQFCGLLHGMNREAVTKLNLARIRRTTIEIEQAQ